MNKDTTTTAEKKAFLRAHFKELRKGISNESRFLLDTALFSNVAALPQFKEANTVLCYYPVKGEPNIIPLIKHAIKLGKRVAFPISHEKERHLSFHSVSDISELSIGTYGIPEPTSTAPEITDFENSLCIVPALAFDTQGRRLGYGGGYYDRFLSGFRGVSLGLAYSFFLVDELPTDEHDALVDIILTEKGEGFAKG